MRWYDDAQQALAEGASVRALNDINRAIELAPWFAPAHAALAEVQLELDMPARAQEAMLRASGLARQGPNVPMRFTRYVNGIQALLLHQCDEAINHCVRSPRPPTPIGPIEWSMPRERWSDAIVPTMRWR